MREKREKNREGERGAREKMVAWVLLWLAQGERERRRGYLAH